MLHRKVDSMYYLSQMLIQTKPHHAHHIHIFSERRLPGVGWQSVETLGFTFETAVEINKLWQMKTRMLLA